MRSASPICFVDCSAQMQDCFFARVALDVRYTGGFTEVFHISSVGVGDDAFGFGLYHGPTKELHLVASHDGGCFSMSDFSNV